MCAYYTDSAVDSQVICALHNSNKKMLVFGDSITETASMRDDGSNYNADYKLNWTTYITKYFGASVLKNYAKAGATYTVSNKEDGTIIVEGTRSTLTHQVDLAVNDASNSDVEIVVFAAGTNDSKAIDNSLLVSHLGTFDNAMSKSPDALDKTELYQAIRYCMWKIKTTYPNAKCFVVTPIQSGNRDIYPTTTKAIIEMGNRYNFIVADAEKECGIVRDNEIANQNGVYLKDGLHPNEDGKFKMAEYICSRIKAFM